MSEDIIKALEKAGVPCLATTPLILTKADRRRSKEVADFLKAKKEAEKQSKKCKMVFG